MSDFLHYLTFPYLLEGALIALEITAASAVGGLLLALVIAPMRESRFWFVRVPAAFYVWIFRGTPLLVQLIFLYDVLPRIGFVLPAIPTAILGFVLNEGAFMGELIRGGIHSVNRDQVIAAESLGASERTVLWRVVLPQAVRAVVPPFGNELIGLLKNTSLASVIAVNELLLRTENIVAENFKFFAVFAASSAMYLVLTTGVAFLQSALELRYNATFERLPGPLARARARWATRQRRRAMGAVAPVGDDAEGPHVVVRGAPDYEVGAPDGAAAAGGRPEAEQALVRCRGVRKAYGDLQVLRNVSFDVERGEVVALIGPSGSGKSTLLRLINHLERLDAGEILVEDELVGYVRRNGALREVRDLSRARAEARIAMVFQQYNLFSHMSALENVMFALRNVYGVDEGEARERSLAALDTVGLLPFRDYKPGRLSGGQQQRVAIARGVVINPTLMLLDEPTSALDPELTAEVRATLKRLADQGMTMLCATHDMPFAEKVAQRVVVLMDGDIIEDGPSQQLLTNPRVRRTREFLGRIEGEDIEELAAADRSPAR